jgi:polysaccharide export outer membrane protein
MKRIKDLNIFVVDDNPIVRRTYQQYLTRLGCDKVRMYENGQNVIDALKDLPDLVLVDYFMEPMNGLEVMKKIKRMLPGAFVVMISGQTDLQVAINAMKYGAFDYIIKGESEGEQIAALIHKMLYTMNLVKRGRPRTVTPQKIFPILPSPAPSLAEAFQHK